METTRLYFKRIDEQDAAVLTPLLTDGEVMKAFGGSYSNQQIQDFIQENLRRYHDDGFSYFKTYTKSSHDFIGLVGPLIENINGKNNSGIAYLLLPEFQGKGYATEAAEKMIDFLFSKTTTQEVIAQVLPNNHESIQLLLRLGFHYKESYERMLHGESATHYLYQRSRESK